MSNYPIKSPRKLIEVALPLGTFHLWGARRSLVAVRAVIFAQLDNNPDWDVSSVNYDLKALLEMAANP